MDKSRWPDRLFAIWLCVSLCWASAACVISYSSPPIPSAERTFRYVNPTPEEQARYDNYDRSESRLTFLMRGSLILALIGTLAFFRRGCTVFILAAALVFVCFVALLDVTWVAP